MKIDSDIFENNGSIPVLYTCNGNATQVPLKISEVPEVAQSLVLIVDDPDAPNGDFVHWLLWNISPNTTDIENAVVPDGAVEGQTSLGKPGYVPPCPPSGIHHYNFKLYALDIMLKLPRSSDKAELLLKMNNHIIDTATLVGLYGK